MAASAREADAAGDARPAGERAGDAAANSASRTLKGLSRYKSTKKGTAYAVPFSSKLAEFYLIST